MGLTVIYVCPLHNDVVLFTEDLGTFRYFVMERPQTCPKCKKPYYKSECDQHYVEENAHEDEG
jgi:hypothetical protein